MSQAWKLRTADDHFVGSFHCMASPCEILIDGTDESLARKLVAEACVEAFRIEQKYSRYRDDNIISLINNANGKPIAIDMETYQLLQFADTCFKISDGLFDITSGVLRKCWKFDGSDSVPNKSEVDTLKKLIGWHLISLQEQSITMPAGFEIDLGGIGKEYAVDNVANLCKKLAPNTSVLVNFGGDIQVTRPRSDSAYWQVGIESPDKENTSGTPRSQSILRIANGGLATSGDANRYLLKNGVRYSHILNPKTGFPIKGGPRSITVAADYCTQSGLLATLALLQGTSAEDFLKQQEVKYWCYW